MYRGKSQLLLFFSRKSIYRILLRPQQKSTYHMQRFKQCEIRYIYQESDISQYTRFNVARILFIAWGHSDFSPPDLVTILHSCCGQSCGQCSGKRLWAVFWAEKHFFIWTKYWAQVEQTSPITCCLCFLWFCYPQPPSGFPLVRQLLLPCFFPIFDSTRTWGRLVTFELYLRHGQI